MSGSLWLGVTVAGFGRGWLYASDRTARRSDLIDPESWAVRLPSRLSDAARGLGLGPLYGHYLKSRADRLGAGFSSITSWTWICVVGVTGFEPATT
jgi:hypothetical protein